MRKALRKFLVASLDGYGDALTWIDFATRGRAQMMIGRTLCHNAGAGAEGRPGQGPFKASGPHASAVFGSS